MLSTCCGQRPWAESSVWCQEPPEVHVLPTCAGRRPALQVCPQHRGGRPQELHILARLTGRGLARIETSETCFLSCKVVQAQQAHTVSSPRAAETTGSLLCCPTASGINALQKWEGPSPKCKLCRFTWRSRGEGWEAGGLGSELFRSPSRMRGISGNWLCCHRSFREALGSSAIHKDETFFGRFNFRAVCLAPEKTPASSSL